MPRLSIALLCLLALAACAGGPRKPGIWVKFDGREATGDFLLSDMSVEEARGYAPAACNDAGMESFEPAAPDAGGKVRFRMVCTERGVVWKGLARIILDGDGKFRVVALKG